MHPDFSNSNRLHVSGSSISKDLLVRLEVSKPAYNRYQPVSAVTWTSLRHTRCGSATNGPSTSCPGGALVTSIMCSHTPSKSVSPSGIHSVSFRWYRSTRGPHRFRCVPPLTRSRGPTNEQSVRNASETRRSSRDGIPVRSY